MRVKKKRIFIIIVVVNRSNRQRCEGARKSPFVKGSNLRIGQGVTCLGKTPLRRTSARVRARVRVRQSVRVDQKNV